MRPRRVALAVCVLIAGWLVFVPLAAALYGLHGGHRVWTRPMVVEEFRRGLFRLARCPPVWELHHICVRHGARNAADGWARGLGLDAKLREQMRVELKRLQKNLGI